MFASRSTRFNPYSLRTNLKDNGENQIIIAPDIPNTALFRRDLGIITPSTAIDPFASNVVFLTYCNKLVKTNGATFTDETGKTITLFSAGSVPARSYIGGYKSGNLFFPGFSENVNSSSNFCQTPPHLSLQFEDNDWTLEFIVSSENWYNGTNYYGAIFLVQRNLSDQFGLEFSYYNNNLRIGPTGGFNADTRIFPWTPSNNRIYYIAARKIDDILQIAIDGIQLGTDQSWTTPIPNVTSFYYFGHDGFNTGGLISIHGIRLTNGVARDIFNIPSTPWVY
ncbi:hypothetical protein V0288_11090 [Pannus brasiliensis CCIBt3594]|uniref:Uncharacterized protein n=1 Tax=Pannus brasiliensis CCIBt3594 TaxID=1427578 RepID=A0AAW9QX97_9CHRO